MDDLIAGLRNTAEQLLVNCKARGYEMRPYFTLRTPEEQAKLWRQSRTGQEIEARIQDLEAKGAPYLARVIREAGPQNGAKVTNAIPGLSWHQWGEAMDCFWLVDGGAEWSTRRKIDGHNGYAIYAEEAERLGLTAGGHWQSFKDWPHVQLRADSNPGKQFSLAEIDAEMMRRFA
jgi:hypothetical protein